MNRLTRIAATLFLSATVLLFIVRRRAMSLEGIVDPRRAASELQMVQLGVVISGILLVAALVVTITALKNRGGKRPPEP